MKLPTLEEKEEGRHDYNFKNSEVKQTMLILCRSSKLVKGYNKKLCKRQFRKDMREVDNWNKFSEKTVNAECTKIKNLCDNKEW